MILPIYLDRAHNYMMDTWTWDFAYEEWNVTALEETLFWYAASGQPISHESTTERWWEQISRGRDRDIPPAARERWADIQHIAPKLRAIDTKTAFGWFLGGHTREAWDLLQKIKYVGPKIASWILRDLSWLRDYATDVESFRVNIGYPERNRDDSWFRSLPVQDQALFLPLDRWVIRATHRHRILPPSMTMEHIQSDAERHIQAATEIASWARAHNHEPRDLNAYFYLVGSEALQNDGLCPIDDGADVWWCYDGSDLVYRSRDWLGGNVVKHTQADATVCVRKQLRDPETHSIIGEKCIQVPLDRLRLDE
jgi:hypothetical protein